MLTIQAIGRTQAHQIKKKKVINLKALALISFSLLFFVSAGVYIAERPMSEDWIWAGIMFLIGYQWVHLFILNKNMYTLYVGEPLYANSGKYKSLRVIHFFIGLVICISSSIAL